MLSRLVSGRDAADIMGFSRPDHIWRAVAKHIDDYPGRLDIAEVGRAKAVRRDQLEAFAEWYGQNVRSREGRHSAAVPEPVAPVRPPPDRAAVMAERRAKLRAAIARIQAEQAMEVYEW